MSEKERNYDLQAGQETLVGAPGLNYRPARPQHFQPRIGLIGCGGITVSHLTAYRAMGYEVTALCDLNRAMAEKRREDFFPQAEVFTDYAEMLGRKGIEVVDIALHPGPRAAAIEAALRADKHVLSQKPFALDLETGRRLASLAAERGRKLAVNQNGRWAPYVRYGLEAARAGYLGTVQGVQVAIQWDHTWTQGTPFEEIRHLILYDFAIHWIDMAQQFFGGARARRVFAAEGRTVDQKMKPPMLATVTVEYPAGLATLSFDGHCRLGNRETLAVTGSAGTYRATGAICDCREVSLFTAAGESRPQLEGKWFNDGFAGTMGELLCAIEEAREPSNSATDNLGSLEVCFAALASAESGEPVCIQ